MTKKQRKHQRGPNAAVRHSLKEGANQGDYVGSEPIYGNLNQGTMLPPRWVKVAKGVPYVRRNRWTKGATA